MIKSSAAKESGEELFCRYLQGDDDAFEALVALYEDDLANFIYSIVHDHHDTKHLTIEVFSELVECGVKFRGASSLKTYLFGIGRNLALRHIRTNRRFEYVSFEDVAGVLASQGDTLQDCLERQENMKRLSDAMQALKHDYRTVLTLLYYEDMSYLQAGREMKKSEKQIKNLAHRARAALRKKLECEDLHDVK